MAGVHGGALPFWTLAAAADRGGNNCHFFCCRDLTLCAVKFDMYDSNDNETHMVELSVETYYSASNTTGKWLLVNEVD